MRILKTLFEPTVIRSILKIGGGMLVARGAMSEGQSEEMIGVAGALLGFIWGLRNAGKQKDLTLKKLPPALLLAITATLMTVGCVGTPPNTIRAQKATVFGLDISQDSTGKPHVRFGLVRYFDQVIPTATNQVFSAPYSAHVDADLGLTKQKAIEDFKTTP